MSNQRFLYYSGWCITDGAVMASGLGYAGKDPKTGEEKFDRIYSIDIAGVELEQSPQIMIQVNILSFNTINLALESYDSPLAQILRLQQNSRPR